MAPSDIPASPARSRNRQARVPGLPRLPAGRALAAACLALALALAGCGSGEDGSSDDTPPDHTVKAAKSQGKWRYGVTDTLVIEFSEPIDTAALEVEFSDTSGKAWRFDGREALRIFGTKRSFGSSHFPVNTDFTLTLRNLRDNEGNTRDPVEEEFQSWMWVDRDFLDGSFQGFDSLFLDDTTWIDGTSMRDSLVVEGALDAYVNIGREDRVDLKTLRLRPPDTLLAEVRSLKSLEVRIQSDGPFAQEGLEEALRRYTFPAGSSTGTQGRAEILTRADYETHDVKLGAASAYGIYALRIAVNPETHGFYRLVLRVKKRRF